MKRSEEERSRRLLDEIGGIREDLTNLDKLSADRRAAETASARRAGSRSERRARKRAEDAYYFGDNRQQTILRRVTVAVACVLLSAVVILPTALFVARRNEDSHTNPNEASGSGSTVETDENGTVGETDGNSTIGETNGYESTEPTPDPVRLIYAPVMPPQEIIESIQKNFGSVEIKPMSSLKLREDDLMGYPEDYNTENNGLPDINVDICGNSMDLYYQDSKIYRNNDGEVTNAIHMYSMVQDDIKILIEEDSNRIVEIASFTDTVSRLPRATKNPITEEQAKRLAANFLQSGAQIDDLSPYSNVSVRRDVSIADEPVYIVSFSVYIGGYKTGENIHVIMTTYGTVFNYHRTNAGRYAPFSGIVTEQDIREALYALGSLMDMPGNVFDTQERLAVDEDGNLYVCYTGYYTIEQSTAEGAEENPMAGMMCERTYYAQVFPSGSPDNTN